MSAPRSILITGGDGQLGTELKRCSWPEDYEIVAIDRPSCDLTDSAAIADIMASRDWAAVINCGAYTAVDKAESDMVTAWAVNALAPAAFAKACAESGIPLVHVSTDYVFSGDKIGPWEVDDHTSPVSVYGASKLGGELAVRTSGARYVIIRTAWVVSPHGNNFVRTMLRLAESSKPVRVVGDQYGSPTSAADLAEALMLITLRLINEQNAPLGIYHFSNAGETNWAEFATEIFRQSALLCGPSTKVLSIESSDYPTPAKRPTNSMLSHRAIRTAFGIEPRVWQKAVGEIVSKIVGEAS